MFIIPGEVDTKITISEIIVDGKTALKISVDADESLQQADLRGLFFDLGLDDQGFLDGLSVMGADVTDSQFKTDKVKDLGNGANLNGAITKKGNGFDAGVEFGTQGIGKDDIDSTMFVLKHDSLDLDISLLDNVRFGVRYTSVGPEGEREDSLKIAGSSQGTPVANKDHLTTDEDTKKTINILDNDSDPDGDPLTVTDISGGTVGAYFAVTTDGGREGKVKVEADGTFTFNPKDNFQDLAEGEMDTVELKYQISDGNGGTDWANICIKIVGVNDAPKAEDDGPFFIESNDMDNFVVLANDTDVDSAIDPSTVMFSGASGTAANDSGELKYTAQDIGGDLIDDSLADTFVYTVDDVEGATSNPANVTVNVIDPLVETNTDDATGGNGQALSLTLSTEDRTFNDSSFVSVDIGAGAVSQNVNVSFVIDGSGSISSSEYTQQLIAVQDTIDDLRTAYTGSAATVTVQLVQFSLNAQQNTFDLFSPTLDDITGGTPLSPQLGGFTNYEAALQLADAFFSGKAAEDNFMLFTSDGEPNRPIPDAFVFGDEVTSLNASNVSITAVGFGGANQATLDTIDNTGGSEVVANAAALGDVFADSPIFPADLISFALSVNGGPVLFDETDLNPLGGGAFDLDSLLLMLDNSHTANNVVTATATFDTDNDGIADETLTAMTNINGTDGSDVIFV
ncbi:Ig-like domain-containing protein [Leisingera daeponensis]|uniref:Ig-like domain-containing protein n=1 Tax=Leisingera daeponensis TaxID=405746 RepID=UPI001C9387E9|nr:Ig-like domain-containing protein [Leisingera daeponensis]MBY6054913.1 cadherin-like domain-containing protein [Leisingera daeponensis]